MPTGVALTMPSADADCRYDVVRDRRAAANRRSIEGSRARRSRRLRIEVEDLDRRRHRARAAHGRPPPRRRRRRAARPSRRRAVHLARKLSAKPQQSVLWPTVLSAREDDRVDRADRRRFGRKASRCAMTLCLNGCVMLRPAKPSAAAARRAPLSSVGSRAVPSASKSISAIRVVEPEPGPFRLVHPGDRDAWMPRPISAATQPRRAGSELERLRAIARACRRARLW